jgi:hypothetical protein
MTDHREGNSMNNPVRDAEPMTQGGASNARPGEAEQRAHLPRRGPLYEAMDVFRKATRGDMSGQELAAFAKLDREVTRACEKTDQLRTALSAASGYLLNAKIDLQTGAPKSTAVQTIEGGLKLVREALGDSVAHKVD